MINIESINGKIRSLAEKKYNNNTNERLLSLAKSLIYIDRNLSLC